MTVVVLNRQRRYRVPRTWLRRLATDAATRLALRHATISIVLLSDAAIARHNQQFHQTPGPTDILTFDYGDSAELLISADHAAANARRYRTTARGELTLYLVHGLLHLAGYDDRTPRQRRRMRAAERALLRHLHRPVATPC
jgi:probable rRNA maturation factor